MVDKKGQMNKCAIIDLAVHQKVTPGLSYKEVKQQMNSTIVKERLTKHFGSPQNSLTLCESRKQGVENCGCPRVRMSDCFE